MTNRDSATVHEQSWKTVREIFWSSVGLDPVDAGLSALGMQFPNAPSPHAVNVEIDYDAGILNVVFHGGTDEQRRAVIESVTRCGDSAGIALEWKELPT